MSALQHDGNQYINLLSAYKTQNTQHTTNNTQQKTTQHNTINYDSLECIKYEKTEVTFFSSFWPPFSFPSSWCNYKRSTGVKLSWMEWPTHSRNSTNGWEPVNAFNEIKNSANQKVATKKQKKKNQQQSYN